VTVNSDILDAEVSHAIGLQRLSKGTVGRVRAMLGRLEERVLGRVARTAISQARQAALLKGIKEIVATEAGVIIKAVSGDMADLAAYEVSYQAGVVAKAVPIQISLVLPSARQVVAAVNARPFQGRIMKEWLADLDKATFARVRDSIRIGYTEGRTTQQIIRDLRGTAKLGFKDGIFEINRRHAEAVVRTAISHTANTSRNALYSANKDVIAEVQWVSTLDGRTSAICQARDGKTWPVDSGPRPPAHPNCRSSMTPIVKSWRGMNQTGLDAETRASMDGQVPASMTYGGWLKKQPVAVQDDILGKAKGKLFRKGGVPVDRFVDYQGHEYTLKELRRREASAFTAAGL